jgi:hypothetical protein
MSMIVPMAAMGVEHHAISTPERLAPDFAKEIIQTRDATSHERTQQDCGVALEGGAQQGRDCQDDMPIDDPLVEDVADLANPVIDIDFGAA